MSVDAEGEVVLEEDWKFLVQFQPEAKDCAMVNLTLNVRVCVMWGVGGWGWMRVLMCAYGCVFLYVRVCVM